MKTRADAEALAETLVRVGTANGLKMTAFIPEYAGKMKFYLNVVDDRMREAYMEPSIGLILCRKSNRVVVEYALRDIETPMGVSEYKVGTTVTETLPTELEGALPSAAQLERVVERTEAEVAASPADDEGAHQGQAQRPRHEPPIS